MSQPPTVKVCDCKHDCVGKAQAHEWGVLCRDVMEAEIRKAHPAYIVNPLPVDGIRPVLKQRGKEYGDFVQMAIRIQEIKRAMITPQRLPDHMQEALDLIATKIGRILTGNPNNEDSWRDIAGYATLVADRIPKPAKTGEAVEIPKGWKPYGHGPDCWQGPVNQIFHGTIEQLKKRVEDASHQ